MPEDTSNDLYVEAKPNELITAKKWNDLQRGARAEIAALKLQVEDLKEGMAELSEKLNAHSHTPTEIGAAEAGHSHTLGELGAAGEGHSHTLGELGAAGEDHSHTLGELGAAGEDHSHTLGELGAAGEDHSHTLGELGAAGEGHSHTLGELGAAGEGHSHTLGELGAAGEGHSHTLQQLGAAAAAHTHEWGQITSRTILFPGTKLSGDLTSDDNRFTLKYQPGDGNLVLYGDTGQGGKAIWAISWEGAAISKGGSCHFQRNGNLVVRDADGNKVWASNTDGNPASFLTVTNTGKVKIVSLLRHTTIWVQPG